MDTKLLGKYESIESFVFMDQRGGRGSSATASPKSARLSDRLSGTSSPLTVAVTVRRGRVFVLLAAMLVVILGLTLTFMIGVEVSRFEAKTKDSASRDTLLDDYNSYSGIVASAFAKPIEFVVTALAQIITLRFMTQALTQPDTTWKQSSMKLALSIGVGYLVSNGFNALNVQLRMQQVRPVISTSDLAVASLADETLVSNSTTTVTKTVPELTPGNLISNTVLRNAVLPRVTAQKDICGWVETRYEKKIPPPLVSIVDFGFSRRDWQSRFLQRALEPQSLRIVVNPTNTSVNEGVKSANLPMNASTAADLVVYFMNVATWFFPWGNAQTYYDEAAVKARYPSNVNISGDPLARVVGLLPPTRESEPTDRDWFLEALPAAVTRQFKFSKNTSQSNIGVEFSHVNISSAIKFDAVTFEVDVDPSGIPGTTQASSNSTRYTEIWASNAPGTDSDCGPWPALCLVRKPAYNQDDFTLDPLQQVQVFSSCVNANGTTELMTPFRGALPLTCDNSSNMSMMVLSVGRRFIADSLFVGSMATGKLEKATITNLRLVYTFTIGRLSWELEDLPTVFNADCEATSGGGSSMCLGLQVPLSASLLSGGSTVVDGIASQQHLVVSADALPTKVIVPSTNIYAMRPRGITLVEVSQYPYSGATFGEILLPHNVGKSDWSKAFDAGSNCDADVEGNIFTRVNNHVYIEHSFQVAYTAATFFLLQDGVVKDVIPLSEDKTTLSFDRNTQDVVVWVSTPLQNALLTIAGCVILVICLSASVFKTMCGNLSTEDPLSAITAPQAIAHIMLVEEQFPAPLLRRRIVNREEFDGPEQGLLDKFTITKITIENQGADDRFVAVQ